MSATVAAALKKIAVALLSNKKVMKKVVIAILSILVALLMPIAAVIGIFKSSIEFDDDQIEAVIDTLDPEVLAKIAIVQATLDEIEEAMDDADMSDRYEEAQMLYMLGLYDYQDEEDFVDRLVGCFEEDQSDYELIEAINDEFDCDIDPEEYLTVVTGMRKATISRFIFENPHTKNNHDLVAWAYEAYDDDWGYVWGSYGLLLTQARFESLCDQYPTHVENHHDFIQEHWVGRRTTDCAGLIKGYLWYNFESGEIEYGSGGFIDYNANDMFANAPESGTIDTIPEIPGLGLWKDGHAGVYIGNGYVIHSAGTETGVVLTKLENTSFTHWFKVPGLTYIEDEEQEPEPTPTPTPELTPTPEPTPEPTETTEPAETSETVAETESEPTEESPPQETEESLSTETEE